MSDSGGTGLWRGMCEGRAERGVVVVERWRAERRRGSERWEVGRRRDIVDGGFDREGRSKSIEIGGSV